VTVLIDEPRWWWRGRRWCHLVSDASLDELHAFTGALGIPRRAFQGDHYDIPEEHRAEVVEAGALEVPSRELVRRLRDAGLRITPAQRRAAVAAAARDAQAPPATASDTTTAAAPTTTGTT
jgi:hypothetical protein